MRIDPCSRWLISRRSFLRGTAAGLLAGSAGWLGPDRVYGREIAKQLNIHTESPMNAEPYLGSLVDAWITPVEFFYVRSHGTLPKLDERQFRLTIQGLVEEPLTLSLAELKRRFDAASAVATLTCAGNRRSEFNPPKAEGVQWDPGAIGNARWKGAKLSDLLKEAKLKEGAKHVWFEGLDQVDHKGEQIYFGGSIPLDKAMQDRSSAPGTILAWEMNEQALRPHHGFPLRTVVPGYIGARSVKWLGKIVISDRPSPNHFVQDAYKLVTETSDAALKQADPLYEYRLNAAIGEPAAGMELKDGRVTVRGYALAPGNPERSIARVEVSADGGRSWTAAELTSDAAEFAWRLWKAEVQVGQGTRHLIARATDSSGETMPETVPWNAKGYLYNGWHKLPVKVG